MLPTALLMIVLVGVMSKLQNNTYIKGMIRGIQPVIFVMMAMLAYDFAKYAMKTTPGFITFIPFLLAAGYFVMVYYLNLSAVYGIIGSLVIGALFLRG